MMEFYNNYLDNIKRKNKETYMDFAQAWTNEYFDNSTLVKVVKEENYPFDNKYNEFEVQQNTVSDVTVNTTKIMGDYVELQFKDCSHRNHRGQKYILEDNQTYLCYDRIEPLSRIAKTKVIRCNNFIKWKDKDNGVIYQEPIFLGYELTSTNNQVSKEGTVSNRRLVVLMQGNKRTSKLTSNQRFMLNHKKVFRITEMNDVIMEDTNEDDSVNMITMYVEWDSVLPQDNKELNICDYYDNTYSIEIDQSNIEQLNGYQGKLTATVKLDNQVVTDIPLKWSTSDNKVVSIDEQGNYSLLGNSGSMAQIRCCIDGNESICDTIDIKIVEDYLGEKIIKVTPIISELNELDTQEFSCGVYINEQKQSDNVKCVPNCVGDNYLLEETIDGYRLTNMKSSIKPLELTFESGSCDPIKMKIELLGMW